MSCALNKRIFLHPFISKHSDFTQYHIKRSYQMGGDLSFFFFFSSPLSDPNVSGLEASLWTDEVPSAKSFIQMHMIRHIRGLAAEARCWFRYRKMKIVFLSHFC